MNQKKKKGRVLKITWRKKDLDIGSRKYQLIFSWLVDVHKHKTFATRRVRWPTSIYHGRGGGGWRIFGCVTIIITWSHHNALCYFFWPTPPSPPYWQLWAFDPNFSMVSPSYLSPPSVLPQTIKYPPPLLRQKIIFHGKKPEREKCLDILWVAFHW